MQPSGPPATDLALIRNRVREKYANYVRYNFTPNQNNILKIFFDLAQEFDSMLDLYRICVVVPHELMQVDCALYLLDQQEKLLEFVCDSSQGITSGKQPVPTGIYLTSEPYQTDERYVLPVYRRLPDTKLPPVEGLVLGRQKSLIMGVFVVAPASRLQEGDRFFLGKYVNRIGFRLHNRQLARQNIRHLKFINTLVMDIEHNVIIPNMYFRHLFNQMNKKIQTLGDLENKIRGTQEETGGEGISREEILENISAVRNDFLTYNLEMKKHHANISLFLESLFRREHFERGHLVLHPKPCMVEKRIIIPQLEHYRSRLQARNITIEQPADMVGEEFPLTVDVGLLAQVYANLFSNAVKYTEEIIDHWGRPRKAVTYGRQILPEFFGPGQKGIKFNVFTTGPHLTPAESEQIFTEGGRARNSQNQEGAGHGLAFIKHVIELHGGKVGYEATAQGNNFYFILPIPAIAPIAHEPLLEPVPEFKERRRGPRDRRGSGLLDRRRRRRKRK